jgi:mRNA degradation ribonuclease J1/J2
VRTTAWVNLSIPIENPVALSPHLPKSNRNIGRAIDHRIKESDCMRVLAAVYAHHREWIQSKLEAAREFGKPITFVKPWGQKHIPLAV